MAKIDVIETSRPGADGLYNEGQVTGIVETVIANDGTVVEAAAAAAETAVTAEVATRDLLEGIDLLADSDVLFAVVDLLIRQTWLGVALDGGPTRQTLVKLNEHIGLLIYTDPEVSGLLFALVDANGRRTELEIGMDGKLTDRVIASIGERLNLQPVEESATIIAPSSIAMLAGQTYRLYYDQIIVGLAADHTITTAVTDSTAPFPPTGNFGNYWQRTPPSAATCTLNLTVRDRTDALVTQKVIPIPVYAAPFGTGKRHLAIGDSISQIGTYARLAAEAIPGMDTVGTRTYDDGAHSTEGRGGWRLETYHGNYGSAVTVDSPFLFPAGVDGDQYWGNTETWRKICYDDPGNYEFNGFQKIGRGWGAPSDPFLFDAYGYPVSPGAGDVVIDPTQLTGERFRQWNGSAWVTMSPQPAMEFSFSKYMVRFADAFAAGGPTSISIMLGTNDFYETLNDGTWAYWKDRMDTTIASIRVWDAGVPVILILPPFSGPPESWGADRISKADSDHRLWDAASRIMAAYDSPASVTNRVYVASFLGVVSPENMLDRAHPSQTDGHVQMAPYLAGMLAKLITEGVS